MTISKLIIACVMMMAASGTVDACYPVRDTPSSDASDGVMLAPSLPANTVYSLRKVSAGIAVLAHADSLRVDATSFDECEENARMRGADAFVYELVVVPYVNIQCGLFKLRYPLCTSATGSYDVHILETKLTTGSPNDKAVLKAAVGIPGLAQKFDVAFRVDSPTILNIEGFFKRLDVQSAELSDYEVPNNFVLLLNDSMQVLVNRRIVVDPICHSTSSCGVPFYGLKDASIQRTVPFRGLCNKRIIITEKGLNVYSHDGIGCKYFPDATPEEECSVLFQGSRTLNVNISFVDFRGSDKCDGYYLAVVVYSSDGKKMHNKVCQGSQTEFTATGNRVRIAFGGKSIAMRKKYGFIIHISH